MKPLVYAITGHGYGHGVRSCDLIRALCLRSPDLRIILLSSLPGSFLENRLAGFLDRLSFEPRSLDVGMVQLDSVRVDLDATEQALTRLCRDWEKLVRQETVFLEAVRARGVVADIPGIPLVAASRAGIPGIAVGNFGWDWIYRSVVRRDPVWQEAGYRYAEAYRGADALIRLPFHEPMSAFPAVVDSPLVSRRGAGQRTRLAELTGADPGKQWALLSFSTLDWGEEAIRRVQSLPDTECFTVKPLAFPGLRAVDRRDVSYTDVLASCDVVITKPGYGVLSECVVHDKPILYVERTDFAEYPVLEASVRAHLRHVHLPAAMLYQGELQVGLEAIAASPLPEVRLVSDEGALAASEILSRL